MEGAVAEADNDTRKVGPVTIHKNYAKSIPGITKAVLMVLSIVGFICVEAADWYMYCGSGAPRFFEFTSMTSFWAVVFLYCIFLTGLNKIIRFIDWELTELIWSAVDGFFYLISSSILAAKTCYSGGLTAGAVFGFLALIGFGINTFFAYQAFRQKVVIAKTNDQQPPAAVEYTPEEKY